MSRIWGANVPPERPMPESEMATLEVPPRCPTCGSDDPSDRYKLWQLTGGGPCPHAFHQSDTESEEGT